MTVRPSHMPPQRLYAQRGLTLTELMVALAISLIVMSGVVTLYVTNRHAYALQNGLARLQENGRFAMEFLSRDLRMGGYPKDSYGGGAFVAPDASNAYSTADGGGDASDAVAVQYEASIDCLGNNLGAATASSHYYYIQNDTLYCRPSTGAAAQPLVDGIENMQVLYGEDTDGDAVPNVYRRADHVADWSKVLTARVAVLATSVDEIRSKAQTDTFTVLDRSITAPNDRQFRRVYSGTIVLRNRLP